MSECGHYGCPHHGPCRKGLENHNTVLATDNAALRRRVEKLEAEAKQWESAADNLARKLTAAEAEVGRLDRVRVGLLDSREQIAESGIALRARIAALEKVVRSSRRDMRASLQRFGFLDAALDAAKEDKT